MHISDVSEQDCRMAAQLINLIQAGRYEVNGKDMCAGSDAIRWLQQVAVDMANNYSKPVPAPATESLKVKHYNPGGQKK